MPGNQGNSLGCSLIGDSAFRGYYVQESTHCAEKGQKYSERKNGLYQEMLVCTWLGQDRRCYVILRGTVDLRKLPPNLTEWAIDICGSGIGQKYYASLTRH